MKATTRWKLKCKIASNQSSPIQQNTDLLFCFKKQNNTVYVIESLAAAQKCYVWLVAQSSASPTPKATPLQSPGVEVPTSELVSIEADETAAATTTTTVTSVTTVDTVEEGNVVETIVHNEVTVVSHTTDNDESVTETAVTKIEEEYTTVEPKEPTPPPPPPAVAEPIKDELVQHQQEPSGDLAEIEMTGKNFDFH